MDESRGVHAPVQGTTSSRARIRAPHNQNAVKAGVFDKETPISVDLLGNLAPVTANPDDFGLEGSL